MLRTSLVSLTAMVTLGWSYAASAQTSEQPARVIGMTLQELGQLGQLLSGISFAITAIMAVSTLFLVHRKQMDDDWLDRFRDLYREFWNDKGMVCARYLINNEPGYSDLREILNKRSATENCDLSLNEFKKLEALDKFCSVLIRVRSFGQSIAMTEMQEELWGDLLYTFWVGRIRAKTELSAYVNNYWGAILKPVKVKRRRKFLFFPR